MSEEAAGYATRRAEIPITVPVGRVQIFKYTTKDRILDVSDLLNLETRRSKVSLSLVDYDPDTKKRLATVRHFADASDFKLVCWDILTGNFVEWTDHKGSPDAEGGYQARVLCIRKDLKYRQPFVIKADNGIGEAMNSGAVKMISVTESLTLLLPEWDARRMAQAVLDYIRDWETIHFKKRQEAQTLMVSPCGAAKGEDS